MRVSLDLIDYKMIQKSHQAELELLNKMLKNQDRQIALLERIVATLESRQDDGR